MLDRSFLIFPNMNQEAPKILSEEKEKTLKFDKIYNGNLSEQIEVFRLFENNMKMREIMKNSNNIPCGLPVDPLSAMTVMGNQ